MRFKDSQFRDPNKFYSDPGSDVQIIYDPVLNEDGTISLKEKGKESISQYINSFKDQTDLAYIIKRIQLGDLSVLNKSAGVFGDFTEMPKTYAEALQLNIDARNAFEALPAPVKAKFENNFNVWFMNAGSEEWLKKMSPDTYKESEVIGDPAAPVAE